MTLPVKVMARGAWKPTATPTTLSDPNAYEYGPRAASGRVWACVGLGTDTIASINVSARNTSSSAWTVPGKLVADPCPVPYVERCLLLFTVGDPAGTRNGVGVSWCTITDPVPKSAGVLIAQTEGGPGNPYGVGQPTVAARPGSPTLLLTTTTVSGVNRIQAHHLHVNALKQQCILGSRVDIAGGDDGASVDAWWLSRDRLALVQSNGSDLVGVRTYHLTPNGSTLIRETGEQDWGNGFYARSATRIPDLIDGAGLDLSDNCQPRKRLGRISIWVATGHGPTPATWMLRKASLPEPASFQ